MWIHAHIDWVDVCANAQKVSEVSMISIFCTECGGLQSKRAVCIIAVTRSQREKLIHFTSIGWYRVL